MPEEINRIVTDSISDYLFTTEESANRNLLREGVPAIKYFLWATVMIDTLFRHRSKAGESRILNDLQLTSLSGIKSYAILTLHRPCNVDDLRVFSGMLDAFLEISKVMPVICPAHPPAVKRIQEADLGDYFVDHFVQGRNRGIRVCGSDLSRRLAILTFCS
jgi:UDP-N-acetylglucosamine 2-epimerase (non-hydrolysing)